MRIAFISNYLNHHQIPFCNALNKLCDEFIFIATGYISKQRLELGYKDQSKEYGYFYQASTDILNDAIIEKVLLEFDIIIFGQCDLSLCKKRAQRGTPFFVYSERLFKKGEWHLLNPLTLRQIMPYKKMPDNSFLLAAGYYAYKDFKFIHSFEERSYLWGYFPEFYNYDVEAIIREKNSNLLWVGRMIDWKRPEMALKAIARLKEENICVKLDFVGTGPLEAKIKALSEKMQLSDLVTFHGSMTTEDVRNQMLSSSVLLTTSTKQEGWGAIVNEAMNSCCVVVASEDMGSAKTVIEDSYNGFLFRTNSVTSMVNALKKAIVADDIIRVRAYETIKNLWSPYNAAERLVMLSEDIISNHQSELFSFGPCSKL